MLAFERIGSIHTPKKLINISIQLKGAKGIKAHILMNMEYVQVF